MRTIDLSPPIDDTKQKFSLVHDLLTVKKEDSYQFYSLALRPLIPGLIGVLQATWPVWQEFVVTGCGLAALWLGTTTMRNLHPLGWWLASLAMSILVAEAMSIAMGYYAWKSVWWWQQETLIHYSLGMFCILFIAGCVTRAAGMSWRRTIGNGPECDLASSQQ